MQLHETSATELAHLIQNGKASAREVALAFAARIEKAEPHIGAFLQYEEGQLLAQADAIDKRLARDEAVGPLAGVPVGVKDNICTKGLLTTCGAKMLADFVPPYSAAVVERLQRNGAVLAGKTNMDAFAMGSSCEHSWFHPTQNPWDVGRVPGGSSGGSAAAVAAGQVPLALGSDTGGSIRQPAAFCGLIGLRPTYGAVSRYGLVTFASSLDQIGPLARTADDAAQLFACICGRDTGRDATAVGGTFGQDNGLLPPQPGVKDLVIGVPKEYFDAELQPAVRTGVKGAIQAYEQLGAKIQLLSLPLTQYALPAYYILSSAEASSNLGRYDGIRYGFAATGAGNLEEHYTKTRSEGFGDEVKRRILLGTHVLSSGYYDAYYARAQRMRRRITAELAAALSQCDMLLTPTAPTTAFALGEKLQDPLAMYQSDICTIPASMAGLPALSVPCGLDENGLPVGFQLIGRAFDEYRLLCAAKCYELARGSFPMPEVTQ